MKIRLLALSLLMIGCQNKFVEKNVNWDSELAGTSEAPQLKSVEGLSAETEFKVKDHKVEFYSQKINGLRVDGTLVKVLSGKEGSPLFINGSYIEEIKADLPETDSVKKDFHGEFERLAKSFPQLKKTKFLEGEIVYSRLGRKLILANLFLVQDSQGQLWQVKARAQGQLISMSRVGSSFENRMAQVYPRGPKQSDLSRVQLFELNLGKILTSPLLQVSSELNGPALSADELLSLNPKDERFDQAQVFYFSQQALRWADERLNVKLNSALDIEVHAGAPDKTNMTMYYNSKIKFGSGDEETYSKIAQDPSIVAHEVFHAVIDQVCRLPFQGEGGSLNEGFADALAVMYLGQPHLGEVAYLKGPFKRTVENQSRFNDRNGGLYHDSLIVSGLIWELRSKIGQEKTITLLSQLLLKTGPKSTFDDLNKTVHAEIKKVFLPKEIDVAEQILKERGW